MQRMSRFDTNRLVERIQYMTEQQAIGDWFKPEWILENIVTAIKESTLHKRNKTNMKKIVTRWNQLQTDERWKVDFSQYEGYLCDIRIDENGNTYYGS